MSLFIKKLFFTAIFNSCLFALLFIGIQNSSNKSKVKLLTSESIELPISFIVGSSFILGSISGSFFVFNNE
jgi:predicted secreted protein